jgi:hypothetical protein
MKNLVLLFLLLSLSSCELIVVGTRTQLVVPDKVEYNQNTALGTIYLFKAELDSNNVPAASQYLKKDNGDTYLAIERYEKFYEIHRIRRMISSSEITDIKSEMSIPNQMKYRIEFDFRRKLSFTTLKVKNYWFITDMDSYE